MVKDFFWGLGKYFEGLRFWLRTKSLIGLSVVSLVSSGVVFAVGLGYTISYIPMVTDSFLNDPITWYGWILFYFAKVLIAVATIWIGFFILTVILNLVLLPFHDALSEKVMRLEGGLSNVDKSPSWMKRTCRNLKAGLRKALIFSALGVLLFIGSLVPGLAVLTLIFGAFLLSWDFMDFAFDHLGLSFAERKQYLRENFWKVTGFSFGLGLTLAVPVVNFFLLPLAVVSATYFVVHVNYKERSIERPNS